MSSLVLENFAPSRTHVPFDPSGPCEECPASYERGVDEGLRRAEALMSSNRAACIQSIRHLETIANDLEVARSSIQQQLIEALSVLIEETLFSDLEYLCAEKMIRKMNIIVAESQNTSIKIKTGTALYTFLEAAPHTGPASLTIEHDPSSNYAVSIDLGVGGIELGFDGLLAGFRSLIKDHIQNLQDNNHDK